MRLHGDDLKEAKKAIQGIEYENGAEPTDPSLVLCKV